MIKYLKSENASILLEYSISKFGDFLASNLSFIEECGFQRIFIECDASKIIKLYNELSNFSFENVTIFIKVKNFRNKYYEDIMKVNEFFYIIVCCNYKEFFEFVYNNKIFYEISFKYDECNDIIEVINKHENILLNINYDLAEINKVNNALEIIINNSKNEVVSFSNMFIEKDLIYKCPYNIYLNNKYSNRSYGKNVPRNLYIDKCGNVYCLNVKRKSIIIGNIINDKLEKILNFCKKNKCYKNFIYYNEILLIKYLNNCPFQMIDYEAFLDEVIKNYEQSKFYYNSQM